jgi:hypothetical protein
MRVLAPFALLVPLSLAAACEEQLPRATVEPPAPPVADAGEDAPLADAGRDAGPVPKGARTLGVAVSVGDVAFADQVRDVAAIGARTTNAAFAWNDVERAEDGGAPVLFHPGIHVVGLVVSGADMQASVALDAMDATGPRLPADLAGRPLDDPEVAARYDAATDYVLSQLPDLAFTAYLVGTDVDVVLGDDAARWAAFATFFDRVASHARTKRAGLRVGFAIRSVALASARDRAAPALAGADVIAVSHAGDVSADLAPIVAAAPEGKPIVIHAVGRPSSPDEQAQAAFVRGVFAAWDRHADRIPVLTFFELDDRPGAATTFGLRRYADGRGKPAFAVLAAEARARGF